MCTVMFSHVNDYFRIQSLVVLYLDQQNAPFFLTNSKIPVCFRAVLDPFLCALFCRFPLSLPLCLSFIFFFPLSVIDLLVLRTLIFPASCPVDLMDAIKLLGGQAKSSVI